MDNHGTTATILLVDGQPRITGPTSALLEIHDYRVYVAHSGTEALQHFRAHLHEIDVVIIEPALPDMYGEECLKSMREMRPDLPVILTTANGVENEFKQRLAPNIEEHLAKPFAPSDLMAIIRKALAYDH